MLMIIRVTTFCLFPEHERIFFGMEMKNCSFLSMKNIFKWRHKTIISVAVSMYSFIFHAQQGGQIIYYGNSICLKSGYFVGINDAKKCLALCLVTELPEQTVLCIKMVEIGFFGLESWLFLALTSGHSD